LARCVLNITGCTDDDRDEMLHTTVLSPEGFELRL